METFQRPTNAKMNLTDEMFIGVYRRQPIENGWHTGMITFKPGTRSLQWTNHAGKSWNLFLDRKHTRLRSDATNPYFQSDPTFDIHFRDGQIFGFVFGSDFFKSDLIDALPQSIGGLKGYISVHVDPNLPDRFGHGVSFYTRIWQLLDHPLAAFQIGLPSTWILPDNRKFCEPLCPPGTVARDNWERTRGKDYFRSVFQTLEGGLGYWCSTQFGSPVPKYRINGTPNGYNHEVSSPAYGFGRVVPLQDREVGLAQLSNRLLIPPDGFTFEENSNGLLGNAWMALPWLRQRSGPSRQDATSFMSVPLFDTSQTQSNDDHPTPTGDNCWTLFLNSSNFAGPVAFYIPDLWSHDSKRYPTIIGRTLDARPGRVHGGAMEINTVPYFQGKPAADGCTYTRIPKLNFPVDSDGTTVLLRDMIMYSKNALYRDTKNWIEGGDCPSGTFEQGEDSSFVTSLTLKPQVIKQGPENKLLGSMDSCYEPQVVTELESSHAFALRWQQKSETPDKSMVAFPEYFKSEGDKMVPISVEEVPSETELTTQEFLRYDFKSPYQIASGYEEGNPRGSREAMSSNSQYAYLMDNSVVEYRWHRFVDQPALRNVAWGPDEKQRLQKVVEEMHSEWTSDQTYMPPPGKGDLVSLDAALVLTPPAGMEVGFVPVAFKQYPQDPDTVERSNRAKDEHLATTPDPGEVPGGWVQQISPDGHKFFVRRHPKLGLVMTRYTNPLK